MKHKIVLLLIAMCSFFKSNAQKEQNNWFFGASAGLTWNTTQSYPARGYFGAPDTTLDGIPTIIPGSPIGTAEGCFSLSDVNGNLLFFSDGMTIWNKNLDVMTNGSGMTGNSSSAQSGIIFPYPNSLTRYIAVTLGERAENDLAYSIVDMNLEGGLGAVETAYKNIPFTGQSGILGESVTAVRSSNKKDFWVVAVGRGTTTYFNVWKATESGGVQTNRHNVASIDVTTNTVIPAGYLKFTQDGKHFVWISMTEPFFVFGDFNPTTGILSNVKKRDTAAMAPYTGGYGVEFSPDGTYLYLTYSPGGSNSIYYVTSTLVCYDVASLVAASDPNLINPIKTFSLGPYYPNGSGDLFSGIQIGPDNRLYASNFNTKGLIVVEEPNNPTTTNVYNLDGLLGTGTVIFGLPSFAAPWFKMHIDPPSSAQRCGETTNTYSLHFENGMGFNLVSKIILDFGDGSDNALVTINNPDVTETYSFNHAYKAPGVYTITATAYNSANVEEVSQTSTMTITSCVLKVNKHIRGVNK